MPSHIPWREDGGSIMNGHLFAPLPPVRWLKPSRLFLCACVCVCVCTSFLPTHLACAQGELVISASITGAVGKSQAGSVMKVGDDRDDSASRNASVSFRRSSLPPEHEESMTLKRSSRVLTGLFTCGVCVCVCAFYTSRCACCLHPSPSINKRTPPKYLSLNVSASRNGGRQCE